MSTARKTCTRLALEVLGQAPDGVVDGDVLTGLLWVLGRTTDPETDSENIDPEDVEATPSTPTDDQVEADVDAAEEEDEEDEDIEAIKLAYAILKRAAGVYTEAAVLEAAVGPVASAGEGEGAFIQLPLLYLLIPRHRYLSGERSSGTEASTTSRRPHRFPPLLTQHTELRNPRRLDDPLGPLRIHVPPRTRRIYRAAERRECVWGGVHAACRFYARARAVFLFIIFTFIISKT